MPEVSPGKPVALVADDDATTRYIFAETLSHEGFVVLEADNGRDALELCDAGRPDIVLLDVEMPILDGYGVCESIRKNDTHRQMPVVMVTTHDDRSSIDRAFEAGATDFISKPISWALLGHRLRYILRGSDNLRALSETLDENRALMAALPDHLFVIDPDARIVEYLRGEDAPEFGGGDHAEGADFAALLPAEQRVDLHRLLATVMGRRHELVLEFREEGVADHVGWRECRFVYHGPERVLAVVRDISERKQAEAHVHELAFFDSLTKLPNRARFTDSTTTALETGEYPVAVFTIDLDRFKRINDTLGSSIGDETLVETSRKLETTVASIVADADPGRVRLHCLACFGGNVFALMLAGDFETSWLGDVAETVGRTIAEPIEIRGHEFVVTASIGVACSPMHGSEVDVLLKNAEAARSAAKVRGSDSQKIYRSSMDAGDVDRLDLENELRRAVESDALTIVFQPKFQSRSGELVGAEALLRWEHPSRGAIPPQTFVRIAEEAGLIALLGEWVTDRVCQQIAGWRYLGLDPGRIAINVSGQEFVRTDPLDTALRAVRRAGIEPDSLELEITETVIMSDIRSVVRSLHRIREAGFSLAVDDFGTGYSSLRYLQRFPVDTLKIDSSFVRDTEINADSRAICAAIIALARSLRLSVVGEGVETEWQRCFLEREGCDVMQGYLLGTPLPAAEYAELLVPDQPEDDPQRESVVRLLEA